MAGIFSHALEDELQVDSLHDAEIAAQKSSDFDILYNDVKNKINDDEESDKDTEEDVSEITSDDEDTEDTEDQSESSAAIESLRLLEYEIATENTATDALKAGAIFIKDFILMLAELGMKYGPGIIKNVYLGIVLVLNKFLKLFTKTVITLSESIKRNINSFSNLKSDIEKLKKTLELIESPDELIEEHLYVKSRTINILKYGDNVDITNNIKTVNTFSDSIGKTLSAKIKNRLSNLEHILSYSVSDINNISYVSMTTELDVSGITKPLVNQAYKSSSKYVSNTQYIHTLPGDIDMIAYLPISNIDNMQDLAKSYNASKLFFGFNEQSFKDVDSINYMTKENLMNFLNELDELCNSGLVQTNLLEEILKKKLRLRKNIKVYVSNVLESPKKLSLKDSLADYIYLKAMFIDKVYVVGMLDIQDYMTKVITAGISFAKDNVKQLS